MKSFNHFVALLMRNGIDDTLPVLEELIQFNLIDLDEITSFGTPLYYEVAKKMAESSYKSNFIEIFEDEHFYDKKHSCISPFIAQIENKKTIRENDISLLLNTLCKRVDSWEILKHVNKPSDFLITIFERSPSDLHYFAEHLHLINKMPLVNDIPTWDLLMKLGVDPNQLSDQKPYWQRCLEKAIGLNDSLAKHIVSWRNGTNESENEAFMEQQAIEKYFSGFNKADMFILNHLKSHPRWHELVDSNGCTALLRAVTKSKEAIKGFWKLKKTAESAKRCDNLGRTLWNAVLSEKGYPSGTIEYLIDAQVPIQKMSDGSGVAIRTVIDSSALRSEGKESFSMFCMTKAEMLKTLKYQPNMDIWLACDEKQAMEFFHKVVITSYLGSFQMVNGQKFLRQTDNFMCDFLAHLALAMTPQEISNLNPFVASSLCVAVAISKIDDKNKIINLLAGARPRLPSPIPEERLSLLFQACKEESLKEALKMFKIFDEAEELKKESLSVDQIQVARSKPRI